MSHTSSESDNRSRMSQKDQAESPSTDEGNSGASFSEGGGSLKKGPWTSAEDAILVEYVKKHGEGNWNAVQKHSGLSRCGKSCRLRWANHLRPNLKKGAFTPEEEQLIIELHARMGNKWARMAAHLPGRTDNEIKNYWNTRIKRCQRAGLPLYPPNICFQSLNENQSQNDNEFSVGDKRNNEHLQPSSYDIPDVIFDNFKANQVLSFMPPFPDISVSSMLNQGLGSQNYGGITPPTLDRFKQLPGSEPLFSSLHGNATCGFPGFEQFSSSEKMHWPLGIGFPYDPDPGSKNIPPLADLASGSHTLPNGNFSTSQTLPVAAKLELPSLQYPETDLSSWLVCPPTPPPEAVDMYVESPLTVSVQSDCSSPRNSGLLEALLHEAQAKGTGKNKPSEKSSNSSTVIASDLVQNSAPNLCYTEGDYSDTVSPLGHSSASVSGACTPLTGGSSLDESPPGKISTGLIVKPEPVEHMSSQNVGMEISPRLDFSRPDELLGSDWCSNGSKNQTTFSDAIANLLGDGVCSEYRHVPTGPSSALTQGLGGINSCPWSYMPPVCQMSELP